MTFMPKISDAFGLYSYMLLAFGVIFQMPVLVLALARMGLVTAGFLWRHTKYAILIIFILAAVITPSSDVVNQSIMAGPMIVLYMLSIVIAWIFGRKKRATDE
jgi:sec-independent protein translocase protein TatC